MTDPLRLSPHFPPPTAPPRGWRIALRRPTPLEPPEIDPDLARLPALPRVAETLRHYFLAVEYAISPGGFLRAWAQSTLFVALLIVLPAILVAPPLLALSTGMALVAAQLEMALRSLFNALLYLLGVVLLALLLAAIVAACAAARSGGGRHS